MTNYCRRENFIQHKDFCDIYSFQHLIKEPKCYKNSNNPKCADLVLTNWIIGFPYEDCNCTEIIFPKSGTKIIMYRDYKEFSNNKFRSIINTNNGNLQKSKNYSLSSFMNVCKEALDKVGPSNKNILEPRTALL